MGAVGILIDWTDEKGVPDRDFLLRVGQEAYQELEAGRKPKALFLLAGSQMDRYRALAEQIPGCWLWDTGSGRLFIYEISRGSFMGWNGFWSRLTGRCPYNQKDLERQVDGSGQDPPANRALF